MNDSTALVERARREIDEGRLPACQLALARNGDLVISETMGEATTETRFVMWSCTKAFTAAAVWLLAGEGLIDLEAPVAQYLAGFTTNGKDAITVDQLLLHTAGIPDAPLGPPAWDTSEGRRQAFTRWRLNWPPGSRYEYHAFSAHWALAEIIVEVTGRDFRDIVHGRVTEPLGLGRFRLGVPVDEQTDIADVCVVGERATPEEWASIGLPVPPPPKVAPDAVLFFNDPSVRAVGIPAAGGISTAADVALFYQGLLHNPGELWRPDILRDGTGVVRNTFPDESKAGMPANRTRGIVVRGDDPLARWRMHLGPATSPRTFGHDGAGGQIAWADPETGISFCYLTNGMEANQVSEATRNQDLSRLAASVAM